VLLEHFQPALNVSQSVRQQKMREVAKRYGLLHFRDALCGVIHRVAIEDYVLPGELALGSDSRVVGAVNCRDRAGKPGWRIAGLPERSGSSAETIRVLLDGPWHAALSGRMWRCIWRTIRDIRPGRPSVLRPGAATSPSTPDLLATHAVELGGKFGLFEYDDYTARFLAERTAMVHQKGWARPVAPDPDARYCQEVQVDLSRLEPQVAKPHNFDNVVPVGQLTGTKIDQAQVGSCANGNVDDIATVVRIVKGKRVHPGTRFFVQPNSWAVYRTCVERGFIPDLLDAGVQVCRHICA
jgi:3-isopropylmalate/(R)-2-methylmalate dehydratase large subunit